MKYFKKFASAALALVMVLALAVPAFAGAPTMTYSITIEPNSANAGHEYEAYQIFTGKIAYKDANGNLSDTPAQGSQKVLSNVEWGTGIPPASRAALLADFGLAATATAADLANELASTNWNASGKPEAAAEIISKYLTGATAGTTNVAVDGKYTISGLAAGYYLVKDKNGTQDDKQEGAYTDYIMQVLGNVNMKAKDGVPTPDKKIRIEKGESFDKVNVSENKVGDIIEFELTATLPNNYSMFKEYYLKFTDNLPKGLTFQEGSVEIFAQKKNSDDTYASEEKVTAETNDPEILSTPGAEGVTSLTITFADLRESVIRDKVNDGAKIIIRYKAQLNANAVIGDPGNVNKMKLDYSNDPNHQPGDGNPPTGVTPEVTTTTYTTGLTITKTDSAGKFLPGVEFTLTGNGMNTVLVSKEDFAAAADGTYWKLKDGTYTTVDPSGEGVDTSVYDSVDQKYSKTTTFESKDGSLENAKIVGIVGDDGTVTFNGLGSGTFTLTETHALPGYNEIDPIEFTITFDATTKKYSSNNTDIVVENTNTLTTSIVNNAGTTLPSTGGIGTTIFYIVGGVLVLGAVILLISKRRASADDE